MKKELIVNIIIKLLLTVIIGFVSLYSAVILALMLYELNGIVIGMAILVLPLTLLFVWSSKHRKTMLIIWLVYVVITVTSCCVNKAIINHYESLEIETNVNINVHEYMPFDENSKIVKLDNPASLKLQDNLPRLDGAAAVFPLYSAFVNEIYPNTTEFGKEIFSYTNTLGGYKRLALKEIDIFFGAAPSDEQVKFAEENGTEFEYTEIGKEGFVFFVNKDNPVDSLTTEQIRGIYSGKITNWKEFGGKDEKILPFQRNEGSGSQSRLIRFMGDEKIMEPEIKQVNDMMSGIIEEVADYRNHSNSIGFSFRYYLETLIANPNVKMLKVDGIAPTPENISNNSYPITGLLYAVTYKGNENENVAKLIDWILSDEGQELVYRTGYSKIGE